MLTLCVRERFKEVLLRAEEAFELAAEAAPEEAGDAAPTGGAPKVTPAGLLDGS